jgi:hypothetical protein
MSDSFFWDPKRQWPQTDATDSQVGEQQLDSTRSTLFTNSASDLQSEQSTLISELSDTLDPRAFSYTTKAVASGISQDGNDCAQSQVRRLVTRRF